MEGIFIIFSFIIILFICLFVIYLILKFKKHKYVYPPYISRCPDYYIYDEETKSCVDKNNFFYDNKHSCYSENFNGMRYNYPGISNETNLCKKKDWAENCSLKWDGITNNKDICKLI